MHQLKRPSCNLPTRKPSPHPQTKKSHMAQDWWKETLDVMLQRAPLDLKRCQFLIFLAAQGVWGCGFPCEPPDLHLRTRPQTSFRTFWGEGVPRTESKLICSRRGHFVEKVGGVHLKCAVWGPSLSSTAVGHIVKVLKHTAALELRLELGTVSVLGGRRGGPCGGMSQETVKSV